MQTKHGTDALGSARLNPILSELSPAESLLSAEFDFWPAAWLCLASARLSINHSLAFLSLPLSRLSSGRLKNEQERQLLSVCLSGRPNVGQCERPRAARTNWIPMEAR